MEQDGPTKDRKLLVTQDVAAGKGFLDSRKFVAMSAQHVRGFPLVVAYADTPTYRQALEHLRTALGQAGLREA